MNKQLSRADDAYREWDAAYVLGALSTAERHEYEEHLTNCPACAAEVASIAGLGGLLASVPRDRALALLEEEPAAGADGGPDTETSGEEESVRQLAAAAVRARRRSRMRLGALLTGTAAAAAAVALVVGSLVSGNQESERGRVVVLQQTIPTAIAAQVEIVGEPWGTRIEIECTYARSDPMYPVRSGQPPSWEYGMYVTGSDGETSLVATWMGGPGTTMWPTGSTGLAPEDIKKVDIRLMKSRTVVLEARL